MALYRQKGELKLTNGSTVSEGIVEICLNETWVQVCDNNWDQQDSIVACKQLGYSDKGNHI